MFWDQVAGNGRARIIRPSRGSQSWRKSERRKDEHHLDRPEFRPRKDPKAAGHRTVCVDSHRDRGLSFGIRRKHGGRQLCGKRDGKRAEPFGRTDDRRQPARLFRHLFGGTCLFWHLSPDGGRRAAIRAPVPGIGAYDTFFIDWVLFANLPMFRLEGTEHMDKAYHQKWFHLKGMLFPGIVFALIPAALVGWLVTLIG